MNEERIELLKKFIEEEPTNPFNKYALSMEYYENIPDKALELLRLLLLNHSDYLPSYFKAAHLLWDMEEWDEAEKVFEDGIRLARHQQDDKALKELESAYLNFQFDKD